MTTAFLATGDEIVHGDTLNTNSQAISQILSSEGVPLGFHLACSDKEQDLLTALTFLGKHHDTIITCGGLGPTSDDRTRFAVAKYLKCKLIEHSQAVSHIEAQLRLANLDLKQQNLQQALFPEHAILLDNPFGTAMGCIIPGSKLIPTLICLPGPPRECMPMLQTHILPFFDKQHKTEKRIRRWLIFGQAESHIAQILDEALSGYDCTTGYRVDVPYVEFKVKMKPQDEGPIVNQIEPIIRPYLLSPSLEKASEQLCTKLKALDKPITILDEVTGGFLQKLIQTPETIHSVVFLPNEQSETVFHLRGMESYWHPSKEQTISECSIHYQNKTLQGSENHTIPLKKKAFALLYATEWLSFRLFQLINQLH